MVTHSSVRLLPGLVSMRAQHPSHSEVMDSVCVCVCAMFVCVRARSCVGGLLEQGIFCVGEERGLGTSSSLVCTAKKGKGQKSGRLENSALHADRSGFKGGGGSWIALEG